LRFFAVPDEGFSDSAVITPTRLLGPTVVQFAPTLKSTIKWGIQMKFLLLSTSAFVAIAAAQPAAAQTTAAGADNSGGIAEVVVTAQRREETLQRAPVTVTAVGADALAKQNVTDFQSLSTLLPNTEVGVTGGARVQIAVRGIRNNDFSPGAEAPVAVHIDGSYIPRMTGLSGLFYDIARVESLPGPQGTLYGRNAAAGAVNIITNHPVNEYQGAAEAEIGNYGMLRAFAMANVPLGDTLAIRAAFQHLSHDPYNKAGGDDAKQDSARLQALWKSGPAKLLLSADYTVIGGRGTMDNDLKAADPYDSRAIYGAGVPKDGIDTKQLGLMAQFDYDLNFATFTAQATDRTSLEHSYTVGNAELSYLQFKSRAKIGEVRLTSNGSKPISWVVGAFGFDEKQPSYGVVGANAASPYGQTGNCGVAVPCGNWLPQLDLRTQSYAFFGQATWTPIDPLHITGGLRYSHDKKDYASAFLCQIPSNAGHTGFALRCLTPPLSLGTGSPADSGSTDYKLGASYDVTPDSLLYANYSTGYRAGGSFISPFNPTYGPEHIKNYELGWKNQFFNHRLVVNLDAYKEDYQDFIFTYTVQGDIVPVPGVFVPFTIAQADNLGKVSIKGADVNATWLATPDDLFNFGAEWIHTEIGKATLRCGAPPARDNGPCVALAFTSPQGKALPNTPEWRLTGGYEHTFRIEGGATVVPRVQMHAESGRWMDITHAVGTRQAAYTKSDASITYTAPGKVWDLSAYVQNIEDKAVFLNAGPANGAHPVQFPSGIDVNYRAPRTFGLKFGAHF
jgi:iron complex outermembrane receptor protein